jgi:hypothetical protein
LSNLIQAKAQALRSFHELDSRNITFAIAADVAVGPLRFN